MNPISIALILTAPSAAAETQSSPGGYVIGAVISLFILVYLIYSLVKPEKF